MPARNKRVVELIKNIRSESATQSLPIIVFSNPYLGNLTRAAVEEGAAKFVAKIDSTPEQMIELLRELGVSASATSRVGGSGMIGTPEANQEKLASKLSINQARDTREAARQLSEFHPDGTGRFASSSHFSRCTVTFVCWRGTPARLLSTRLRG